MSVKVLRLWRECATIWIIPDFALFGHFEFEVQDMLTRHLTRLEVRASGMSRLAFGLSRQSSSHDRTASERAYQSRVPCRIIAATLK
jgi:hypothetical protein